jgi:D-glycero-beta-D-manno-heptose-7-phosphate kinase
LKAPELDKIFEAFNHQKVLIIGDVMIDAYMWGSVTRISPEAPVPIVAVKKRENRLGGAANVALNVKAMGATPILCSVIGADSKSNLFLELLKEQGMDQVGIIQHAERITTVKTRIIGNNHQMLRVDSESDDQCSSHAIVALFERIETIIEQNKIDVIIFEDYDKGVITSILIDKVVALANLKEIPVAVDPKKRNFNYYKSVSLLKPNLKELREGLKTDGDLCTNQEIFSAVKELILKLKLPLALVTLSEKGILAATPEKNIIIPAHIRNIADVSGAGDTVISIAAMCLAQKLPPEIIAGLSNLAGGLVCEYVGVVPVNKDQLYKEAIEFGNFAN